MSEDEMQKVIDDLTKKYVELETAYKTGLNQFELVKNKYLQICEAHANKCIQFDLLSDQYRAAQQGQ